MSYKTDDCMTVAFIFDSGRLDSCFYGEVVFEHILNGKEITRNSKRVIISIGDIPIYKSFIDIEPFVLNNSFCTVDFDILNKTQPFKDYPFCWMVEDIDYEIAIEIDRRLRDELQGYIGITEINPLNRNESKQFWKEIPRRFAVFQNFVTVFQKTEINECFMYETLTENLGYHIEYAKETGYSAVEDVKIMQTSCNESDIDCQIKEKRSPKSGADRDLMELNFSLNRELQISGALIWKSVIDISKVTFSKENYNPPLFENYFFALYHASQGIERLQKIIVELICKKHHIKQEEKEKVDKLLLSHNHHALNSWIEEKESIVFDKNCKNFFCILQEYYNNVRYVRYADNDVSYGLIPEYKLLKKLGDGYKGDNIDHFIKSSFGAIIGKIAFLYYKKMDELCTSLNIFAYELYAFSTATIVYGNVEPKNYYREYLKRQLGKKELFYWLIKNGNDYPYVKYFNTKALEFDPEMIDKYISDFINDPDNCERLHDEIDILYDDMCASNKESWKQHKEEVDTLIANTLE